MNRPTYCRTSLPMRETAGCSCLPAGPRTRTRPRKATHEPACVPLRLRAAARRAAQSPAAVQAQPRKLGEPYYPFGADQARQTILEQLRKASGGWVGKRRIFRACGMHPTDVAILVLRMEDEAVVESGQKFWPSDQYRITTGPGQ